jgi:hypothetical protein
MAGFEVITEARLDLHTDATLERAGDRRRGARCKHHRPDPVVPAMLGLDLDELA